MGVLYCFGGGAARRVGIQLILKIPYGFATRFTRTYSWCASRDSTNQNASFVDWWWYTAISRKVVGKIVHATIPKGNMGYDQYAVPETVAVEFSIVTFL